MADVRATFVYDANFSSAISQVKALSKEVSLLNQSFNAFDKVANNQKMKFANAFKSTVGDIGGFTTKMVDMTSSVDAFGTALDKNKLTLRQYAKEASNAFKSSSNARKLAESEVKKMKSQLVDLGFDQSGRRKGMLVTPLSLDTKDFNTKMEIASKQWGIFNKLIADGSTQLINWGKNTQWAGRQLTVGLTVPMTIFAATVSQSFREVDKELTRFQKVYGSDLVGSTKEATNEMRRQVQSLAVDIAKQYGIAVKETAGLAADLAATGLEGERLTGSIKETTRLAVLGEVGRQDAMKATLAIQNAFNMNTKELAESINFLNAVENQTSASLQDLTEAIPRVGPVINALGGDIKDLSVLLVAMKEGGVNAAEGANAIKSGMAALINPTKQAKEAAAQYGINLDRIVKDNRGKLMPTILAFQQSLQTLDEFGRAQIIEQLFGKYQFARISALFDNLNASGSQTVEVLKLMGASSEDLAKIAEGEIKTLTESSSMRFQRAMEAIKASLLPVGESITNMLIPPLEKLSSIISQIIEFGSRLPDPIKNFVKFATVITAVAGPLIMITGVLANFLGYIVKGSMGFVNLGRKMVGLPVEKFSVLSDEQIAAAKATDVVTTSITRQDAAMRKLISAFREYGTVIRTQAAVSPSLFVSGSVPSGPKRTPKRKQTGGAMGPWVPGSGEGDRIPALLEPGEYVVNKNAAKQYGGLLNDMNFNMAPRFNKGGYNLKASELGAARSHLMSPTELLELLTNLDTTDLEPDEAKNLKRLKKELIDSSSSKTKPTGIVATGFGSSTSMLEPQFVNNALQGMSPSGSNSLPAPLTLKELNETMKRIDDYIANPPKGKKVGDGVLATRDYYAGIKKEFGTQAKFRNFIAQQIANNNLFAQGMTPDMPDWDDALNKETKAIARTISGARTHKEVQLKLLAREVRKRGTGSFRLVGPSETVKTERGDWWTKRKTGSDLPIKQDFKDTGTKGKYRSRFSPMIQSFGATVATTASRSTSRVKSPAKSGGRYSGLITTVGRMGFQNGSWVPGSGSGDRIPAMLEPGEFVVNRNAAKMYGGVLEDINNGVPRFNDGGRVEERYDKNGKPYYIDTVTGKRASAQAYAAQGTPAKTGRSGIRRLGSPGMMALEIALSALASSVVQTIPGFDKMNGTLQTVANIASFMLPGMLLNKVTGGKGGGISKLAGQGVRGLATNAVQGVGRSLVGSAATRMIASPGGLIAGAVVGSAMLDQKRYNQGIKEGTAVFGNNIDIMEMFGVEVRNVTESLGQFKSQAASLGFGGTSNLPTNDVLSAEQKMDILASESGKQLIEILKKSENAQSVMLGKFSQMVMAGYSPEEAQAIVELLAAEAGQRSTFTGFRGAISGVDGETPAQQFEQLFAIYSSSLAEYARTEKGPESLREVYRDAATGQILPTGTPATVVTREQYQAEVERNNGQAPVGTYAYRDMEVTQGEMTNTQRGKIASSFSEALNTSILAPDLPSRIAALDSIFTTMESFDPQQLQVAGDEMEKFVLETLKYQKDDPFYKSFKSLKNTTDQGILLKAELSGMNLDEFIEDGKLSQEELDEIGRSLDTLSEKAKIQLEIRLDLQSQSDTLQKEIDNLQVKYQEGLVGFDNQVTAENERYENAQKAAEKFIKDKQKEIDATNKAADAYIDALQKEAKAEDFASRRRETSLGGLQALAGGDVFGFIQAQQQMSSDAEQYGFQQEIDAIDERRNKEVESLEGQIDKKREEMELYEEAHQNRLAQIEAQRQAFSAAQSQAITELGKQKTAIDSISGNEAVTGWLTGFADEGARSAVAMMMVNYLMQNPTKSPQDALTYVQGLSARGLLAYERSESPAPKTGAGYGQTGSGGESKYAYGGFVSGPGTPTSDSIPARLSNGEYVIQASSVKKFGVDAFDQLNNGEPVEFYADGGFVMPTRSGANSANYGKKGPLWSLGYHTGLDFSGKKGTDILSVGDGVVASKNAHGGSYGKHITVRHSKDLISLYAHLDKILVDVKDNVKKGQHIGEMGDTGNVTGTHLHFEMGPGIFKNAKNPLKYLLGAGAVGGEDIEAILDKDQMIQKVAETVGIKESLLSSLMKVGSSALLPSFNARQFGGSMTMNKPYLVGENGPEFVMPYGSGGKVSPIKYSVPKMAEGGIINGATPSGATINMNINGVNDPNAAAERAVKLIKSQEVRRNFSVSVGGSK